MVKLQVSMREYNMYSNFDALGVILLIIIITKVQLRTVLLNHHQILHKSLH